MAEEKKELTDFEKLYRMINEDVSEFAKSFVNKLPSSEATSVLNITLINHILQTESTARLLVNSYFASLKNKEVEDDSTKKD